MFIQCLVLFCAVLDDICTPKLISGYPPIFFFLINKMLKRIYGQHLNSCINFHVVFQLFPA